MSGTTLHGLYEEWEREEKSRREQSERLKDLFKAAKSDGWNAKALRAAFAEKYAIDHEAGAKLQKRSQDASDADLYLAELSGPRTPAYPRVEIIEEFDAETGEITPSPLTKAAGQAVTARAAVHTSSVENEAAEISTTIQPETANEAGDEIGHVAADAPDQGLVDAGNDADNRNPGGENVDAPEVPATPTTEHAPGKSVEASASAAPASITYPAPGLVVMEHTPPEGAIAHPYATCWPVRDIDPAGGIREPIVKIGKLILDGRGRMFAARGVDGGKGIEYPVVQYAGADPLMDSIQWNLASRPNLHPHNLKMIATKLTKLEPARADEIMAAFGLDEERQAAE